MPGFKEALERRREVVGVVRAPGVYIAASSEDIDFLCEPTRPVVDVEVERLEELRPSSLATVEVAFFAEVLEVLMVGEHFHTVSGSFQVVTPVLEGVDDGEEFLVVNVVVPLGRCHGA